MKAFFSQLKWQFILLQKNQIISISLGVTLFYGAVLFAFRNMEYMQEVLTVIILSDPATIGYFFIGLAISSEKKNLVLSAVFVTPVNHHFYIITKVLAIAIVGWLCAIALIAVVLGLSFDMFSFTVGILGICILSALLGIMVVSYTFEFLRFSMYSLPIFLAYLLVPMLNYLGIVDVGIFVYLFPVQGALDLIIHSYGEKLGAGMFLVNVLSLLAWIGLFYFVAFRLFQQKVIRS